MDGHAAAQCDEDAVGLPRRAERLECHVRQGQAHDTGGDHEGGPHEREPTADPADGRWQLDVRAQPVGCGFDTARGGDLRHDVLEIIEGTGKPAGQAIRKEAEGLMGRRAVVPRDAHPRGRLAGVRPVTDQPAPTRRMARTRGQPCLHPGVFGKIGLAGQRCLVTQLHRPAHGTGGSVACAASLPRRCSTRRRGRFLSQLVPRPQRTLRPAIHRFLSGPIREELSEGLRYYVRANSRRRRRRARRPSRLPRLRSLRAAVRPRSSCRLAGTASGRRNRASPGWECSPVRARATRCSG